MGINERRRLKTECLTKFRDQVVADTQRVCDDRERWIHGRDAWEKTRIDDVEVIDVMSLAILIQYGCGRVGAEPASACLMTDASDWDLFTQVEIVGHQVSVAIEMFKQVLQFLVKHLGWLVVVKRVAQLHTAVLRLKSLGFQDQASLLSLARSQPRVWPSFRV